MSVMSPSGILEELVSGSVGTVVGTCVDGLETIDSVVVSTSGASLSVAGEVAAISSCFTVLAFVEISSVTKVDISETVVVITSSPEIGSFVGAEGTDGVVVMSTSVILSGVDTEVPSEVSSSVGVVVSSEMSSFSVVATSETAVEVAGCLSLIHI